MGISLKQLLITHYNVTITRKHYLRFQSHVLSWEQRQRHAEGLNSPLLGVEKIHFLTKDRAALFDLFDIEESEFTKLVHSADSVDPTRKVSSDAYNNLTVWIAHLVGQSKLSRSQKEDFQVLLFKMMNYKFFTSFVNFSFRYAADPEVMAFTIDNLSAKFEIRSPETPTWRLVIEARAKDVIGPRSIHAKTLKTYSTDDAVLYVITDNQTRIKQRLIGITRAYHVNKKANNRIATHAIVDEFDGEKVIKNIVASFDQMINGISADAINLTKFLNYDSIDLVIALNKALRKDMFRGLLSKFSDRASTQYRMKDQDKVEGTGSHRLIVGYRALISAIIQTTYRAAILDPETKMDSRLSILDKTRNMFRSSRVSDENVQVIKQSVSVLVDELSNSRRDSTNASLKIAFITYIILLSFSKQ